MIKDVLVCCRGEIALRIIRTCRRMGIKTVAAFLSEDEEFPFVWAADDCYRVKAEPRDVGSIGEELLKFARNSDIDAVAPGYGPLAENANFAAAVAAHDLRFVGPSLRSIRAMGDKANARRMAVEAGLPTVPGSDTPVCGLADAAAAAAAIGYPVVLKAVLGGGGRGMRCVATRDNLPAAVEEVRREAVGAFGREDFYVEKYLNNIRHIEVQLIGDQHGNLVSLGTRECSVQRNHQKVVEEAPARLDPVIEDQLTAAACRLGSHIGYDSAGTVEFLVDREGRWYFIEMNTRIQVEHTITEAITGIDIIELMLQSASSAPLAINQSDIRFNGHAMEFRVCAEDPFNAFRPELGTVELLRLPGGPGIRLDSGIERHCKLSVHFDSLCAKLTFWGPTREVALARARIGFEEFGLVGFQTNVPFHKWLMQQPELIAGDYDLSLANRFSPAEPVDGEDAALHLIAALVADNDLQANWPPDRKAVIHPSVWQLANESWFKGKFWI